MWRGLFTLLQDEDQDVRAAAADFASAPAGPLSAGRRQIGRWGGAGLASRSLPASADGAALIVSDSSDSIGRRDAQVKKKKENVLKRLLATLFVDLRAASWGKTQQQDHHGSFCCITSPGNPLGSVQKKRTQQAGSAADEWCCEGAKHPDGKCRFAALNA